MRKDLPLKEHVQHTWNDLLIDTRRAVFSRCFTQKVSKLFQTVTLLLFKLRCEKIPYEYLNYSTRVERVSLRIFIVFTGVWDIHGEGNLSNVRFSKEPFGFQV